MNSLEARKEQRLLDREEYYLKLKGPRLFRRCMKLPQSTPPIYGISGDLSFDHKETFDNIRQVQYSNSYSGGT